METLDREVDRVLTLLRNKIRERGFTQLQVQEELGWGRSYISQLFTRQKALRMEQVLLILSVIDVQPTEFFAELYWSPTYVEALQRPALEANKTSAAPSHGLGDLRALVHRLVDCLVRRELITAEDLATDPNEDPG